MKSGRCGCALLHLFCALPHFFEDETAFAEQKELDLFEHLVELRTIPLVQGRIGGRLAVVAHIIRCTFLRRTNGDVLQILDIGRVVQPGSRDENVSARPPRLFSQVIFHAGRKTFRLSDVSLPLLVDQQIERGALHPFQLVQVLRNAEGTRQNVHHAIGTAHYLFVIERIAVGNNDFERTKAFGHWITTTQLFNNGTRQIHYGS